MQTVGAVGRFQFRRSGLHHVGVDVDKGEAFCLAIGLQQAVDGGDIVGFSVERFPTLKVFIDGQETLNVERRRVSMSCVTRSKTSCAES